MKIAILVSSFPPKWLAGTEIATYHIAKYLAKRGHEVHVITSLDDGLPREEIKDGFHIHRIKKVKALKIWIVPYLIKMLFLIKKIDPDIIHSQMIFLNGWIAFLIKRIFKKSYVVWAQGSDVYCASPLYEKTVSKTVLKNADTVIALTDDMKKKMKRIYDREIFVIPNGLNLERFKNLSRDKFRKKLNIKEDEKVVIFVGTLRPVKGVKYLIEAMDIIRQKEPSVRLMLVGDGKERKYLENLTKKLKLENCIRFIGKVPNNKVPEYMAASDVFVLPSLSESFGIVNLEAMGSGLPIVATNVGGLPEIIEEGENGFLVESKNPEKIAEKVLLLLGDNELREIILRNNKEKVKRYSWESVVEILESIYLKIVRK